METPPPVFQKAEIEEKKIKFINEYNLNFDNINYLLKFGKIKNNVEELIIFIKEENVIDSYFYQQSYSLEELQKKNKSFRLFDSIDETIECLKDIISEKKVLIKKINEVLTIIFILNKLGKGEEEVNFTLTKNNLNIEKVVDNLISHIKNINIEINELKNEIKDLKIENENLKKENKIINEKFNNEKVKIFYPQLENGWTTNLWGYEKLTIYKNQFGEVKFEGLINGDFSKKIFTLPDEFRTNNRQLFIVYSGNSFNRIDILNNGDVYLSLEGSNGIQGSGWVSLNGISYYSK